MKYTKEILEIAVKNSRSISGVLRYLNLKFAGGTHKHISNTIRKFNIDTRHFTGSGWNTEGISTVKIRTSDTILIKSDKKEKTRLLKRAMLEQGIKYLCVICNNRGIWLNSKLTLQIDHINGDSTDHRLNNLRFLCPNCHSQTETFGYKGRNR